MDGTKLGKQLRSAGVPAPEDPSPMVTVELTAAQLASLLMLASVGMQNTMTAALDMPPQTLADLTSLALLARDGGLAMAAGAQALEALDMPQVTPTSGEKAAA